MSLKHFHVFFIMTALSLMAFLSYWSGQRALGAQGSWTWACLAAAAAAGGVVYLRWFLRKHRTLQ